MECIPFDISQSEQIVRLVTEVFTDSEGEGEGSLIGNLTKNMINTTQANDLIGFVALDNEQIVASIFFSRLTLSSDQTVFILSPVAVATESQKQGIGQKLIQFGLDILKSEQVDFVFTYGDPNYYSKTGFQPITEGQVKAPVKLSSPHGWLAQSLKGEEINLHGVTADCVPALNDQKYW